MFNHARRFSAVVQTGFYC
uniref:Uncharacterized protein n=1 Tax=Anguilla anguilla TaxID=7936 RepID=A0A0E9URM0_ANGAN